MLCIINNTPLRMGCTFILQIRFNAGAERGGAIKPARRSNY
jgi:hypothetical protein